MLPIPPPVVEILKASGGDPDLAGPAAGWDPRIALKHLYRLCETASVTRVSWYALRHTALTLMAEREPLHVVQRYAGHKSIETTQIYLHAQEHHLRAAADRGL